MKFNRIYAVVGVVVWDLLAVAGLLVFIIGFGLRSNNDTTTPSTFVGIQSFPYWALAIGAPFALLAFLAHAIVIAVEMLRTSKIVKSILSAVLTVLFVWMLTTAGAVLHRTSINFNDTNLESAFAASFVGALMMVVFGGLAFGTTLMSVVPVEE